MPLSAQEEAEHQVGFIARSVIGLGIRDIVVTDATVASDDLSAEVSVTFTLRDNERLDVRLQIDVSPGWPVWVAYSLHVRDLADRCMIRIDNVPHYREFPNFPHHVHIGPNEVAQPLENESKRHILSLIIEHVVQHRSRRPG